MMIFLLGRHAYRRQIRILLQLTVHRQTFLDNFFAILRFEADRNVAKLAQPVDKDKWATEPAVVNAFYNPNKNDIGTYLQQSLSI